MAFTTWDNSMALRINGSGNLGSAPELRTVEVSGEDRKVASMRVFFDHTVPDGNGGFVDKGGCWLGVSAWDNRAEHVARVLRKGMRVRIEGTLQERLWEKDGEAMTSWDVNARNITLELARLESVTLRPKASAGQGTPAAQEDTQSSFDDAYTDQT